MKNIFENRKNVYVGIAMFLVIVFIVIVCAITFNKDKLSAKNAIHEKIKISDLEFDNGSISQNDGLFLYKVDVKNTVDSDVELKYFTFDLYDENDKIITTLVGYAADTIKGGKKMTINATSDVDIRSAKSVKINIVK